MEMDAQGTNLKVVLLGGTGFVGTALTEKLRLAGMNVVSYGRNAFNCIENLKSILEGSDILIMLAGANIGERWTAKHKQAIWDSRLKTNAMLATALSELSLPPKRIFSASAVGIYPQNDCTNPVDESCLQIGQSELGILGSAWEQASRGLSPEPVIMRFGVVLEKHGGALAKMLPPFKMGVGGPVAGGQQCMSWIHLDDLCEAVLFLINNPHSSGVYNLCAPTPVSNCEFGATLAKVLHRPFWLPLPAWFLKIVFGEGAQVLTHSSAVIPKRLLAAGFSFRYPTVQRAMQSIFDGR
ncbi:TIGR01777 family oxidoreductase [Galenea microaerophila]